MSLLKRSILKLKILKYATEIHNLNNIFVYNQFNHVIHHHVDNTYSLTGRVNSSKLSEICEKGDSETLNKMEEVLKDL